MPVTLAPSAAKLAEMMRGADRPPLDALTVAEARQFFLAGQGMLSPPPPPMESVEDMSVPSPHGTIPIRIYRSLSLSGMEPATGLVFYHGGGWVYGNLESHDVLCREIATAASVIVVAVDYRLAPENKFPAPLDDCITATEWVAGNAASLGIDKDRLFVGGDSAGGNLATVVAMHARDNGIPHIAGQILIYPVTDLALDTASHADPETDVSLTSAAMHTLRSHYLSDLSQIDDWRVSPLKSPDLNRLPPAFVLTCGADPLHDEGEEYARRLKDAGNDVTYIDCPGHFHGFMGMGKMIPEANEHIGKLAGWLKQQAG